MGVGRNLAYKKYCFCKLLVDSNHITALHQEMTIFLFATPPPERTPVFAFLQIPIAIQTLKLHGAFGSNKSNGISIHLVIIKLSPNCC